MHLCPILESKIFNKDRVIYPEEKIKKRVRSHYEYLLENDIQDVFSRPDSKVPQDIFKEEEDVEEEGEEEVKEEVVQTDADEEDEKVEETPVVNPQKKRGRPRKIIRPVEVEVSEAEEEHQPPVKRRGRPPKVAVDAKEVVVESVKEPKKRKGRPAKDQK